MLYLFPSDRTKNKKCYFFVTPNLHGNKSRNEDQLRPPNPLCPFAIHILNRLDRRIHQISPKIYHTYQIIEKTAIEWSFLGYFWLFLRSYIAKTVVFNIWVFWVKTMHSITLHVIDIHNVRCLEPFLPLSDHFEIGRFLGPNWQY